jgi:hypothetical protein
VTNGKRLHVISPGDTKWSRRFADVLGQVICDLGGPDGLSEGQRQLARRCATIAIACERMEGEAAAGAAIDLEAIRASAWADWLFRSVRMRIAQISPLTRGRFSENCMVARSG